MLTLVKWINLTGIALDRFRNPALIFLLAAILIVLISTVVSAHVFQSYWIDELFSARVSDPSISWRQTWAGLISDVHPPLYQLILKVWYICFGWTEASGRWLSILLYILTLFVLYLTARICRKPVAAMAIVVLFAAFWPFAYFALEVRSYILLALIVSVANFAVLRILSSGISLRRGLVLMLSLAAAMYTHYYGILYSASLGFFFLVGFLFSPRAPIEPGEAAPLEKLEVGVVFSLIALGAFLLFSPWLFVLFNQSGSESWMARPNDGSLMLNLIRILGGELQFWTMVGLCVAAISGLHIKRLDGDSEMAERTAESTFVTFCFFSSGFVLIAAYVISLTLTPILTHKALIVIMPGLGFAAFSKLSAPSGLTGSAKGGATRALFGVLIFFTLISVWSETDSFKVQKKQDWRAASAAAIEMADGKAIYSNRSKDLLIYLRWSGVDSVSGSLANASLEEEVVFVVGHTNARIRSEFCLLEERRFRRVRVVRVQHISSRQGKCNVFDGKLS